MNSCEYSHPDTVLNNIANLCESMAFICVSFHIQCVHKSFFAHNTRNITAWFNIVSYVVQFCVLHQDLLCRKPLFTKVARVIDGIWIHQAD